MSEYNTGTVSVTNGDATVTGTSTLWLTNVSAGDIFTIVESGVSYIVGSITDDTHLELTGNYTGATASGQSYTISSAFTSPDSIPYPETGDTQPATILARMAAKIQELFTTRETAYATNAATGKTTPVDADALPLVDSADSNTLKQLTWANLKATLATWLNDLTATWSNKTLTAPDINGGTADALTSLTVAAGADGNVSRWVMDTVSGGASDSGYWAKLFTLTPDTSTNTAINLSLELHDGKSDSGLAKLKVTAKQVSSGLDASVSELQVLSISGSSSLFHRTSFKLVAASATNGTAIELWAQKNAEYGKVSVYEISKQTVGTWTVSPNNGAAWQSATPTGAVEITSDWAGSGTWTPTIIGLTTAGTGTYTTQVGYYQENKSTITLTGRITWTAHTGTGNMAIGGFPVAAASANQCAGQAMHQNIAGTGDMAIYVGSGLSYGSIYSVALGGTWAQLAVDTAGDIIFTITYRKS